MRKIFLLISFLFLTLQISLASASFTDLPSTHPYFKAISYLETKGIIKGYSDKTARAEKFINRAEFSRLIVEGFKIKKVSPSGCFSDINPLAWYAADVCTLKNVGIVSGLEDGRFDPARPIIKSEASKMIVNVTKIPFKQIQSKFKDIFNKDWFYKYITALEAGNFLEEHGEIFFPEQNYTRGQISEILYRILVTQEKNLNIFVDDTKTAVSSEDSPSSDEIAAFNALNKIRIQEGKTALKLNPLLSKIARIHSVDMATKLKKLSHPGFLGETSNERIQQGKIPDFTTGKFTTVATADNITWTAENVGRIDLQDVGGDLTKAMDELHKLFMDEPNDQPNHRTNILGIFHPYNEVGIGIFIDDQKTLWLTQDFAVTS